MPVIPKSSEFKLALASYCITAFAFASFGGVVGHYAGSKKAAQDILAGPPITALSTGRQQLLNANIAGSRDDYTRFMTAQANAYFASKGLPCDPVTASVKIGDTMLKAKCPAAPSPK